MSDPIVEAPLLLLPAQDNGGSSDDGITILSDAALVGLKRQVGLLGLLTFLVGSIIGSGIFASPAVVAMHAGSTGVILLTWVAGGVIAVLGALTYCELALTFPKACGNEYSYIYEAFGSFPSFVVSYLWVITKPAGLSMAAIVAGDYVMTAISGHGNSVYSKAIAACVIGVNTLINCYSVKWTERMQILFTAAKMVPITMLVVSGLIRIGKGYTENFQSAFNGSSTSVSDITLGLYGGLFSYGGWDMLNYITAETMNPIRDIPIAIAIGIPLVTICYIMVNIAYLTMRTPLEIAKSNAIAVDISKELYGVMNWIIPALVACSVYGTCNSGVFATSRCIYEASNRNHLPKLLGSVHLTRHTPIPALIFSCLISWLVLIPKATTFGSLLSTLMFTDWTIKLLVIAALIWMRRSKPSITRPFKVFLLIPMLLFVIGVYVIITPFVQYPVEQSIGLGIVLSAVPFYLAFIRYQILPQSWMRRLELITVKIQRLGNLGSPDSEKSQESLMKEEELEQF